MVVITSYIQPTSVRERVEAFELSQQLKGTPISERLSLPRIPFTRKPRSAMSVSTRTSTNDNLSPSSVYRIHSAYIDSSSSIDFRSSVSSLSSQSSMDSDSSVDSDSSLDSQDSLKLSPTTFVDRLENLMNRRSSLDIMASARPKAVSSVSESSEESPVIASRLRWNDTPDEVEIEIHNSVYRFDEEDLADANRMGYIPNPKFVSAKHRHQYDMLVRQIKLRQAEQSSVLDMALGWFNADETKEDIQIMGDNDKLISAKCD